MSHIAASLLDLPPEVILQIHFLARNSALSLVSRSLHANLSAPYTTPTYIAQYLLAFYSSSGPDAVLVKALRHPVCTIEAAEAIRRIWDKRRGYELPTEEQEDKGKRKDETRQQDSDSSSPSPPPPPRRPTRPALTVPELPRRLFRDLSMASHTPPLVKYLFDNYSPSANSHNGYPLSRAVLSKNKAVIEYLLSKGAHPGLRDGLAIEIAVKLGDIDIVRMLVDNDQGKEVDISSRFVELAVRSGSDKIVQYFVNDKGVMPPLHSIMQLSGRPEISLDSKKRRHADEAANEVKNKKRKSGTASLAANHKTARSASSPKARKRKTKHS